MAEICVRAPLIEEAELVVDILREAAVYQGLQEEFSLTSLQVRENLIGPRRHVGCLIAFVAGEIAGIAIWFDSFRSFTARRGFFLEDIFVKSKFRGCGVGTILLERLAKMADGDGFIEWVVFDWNRTAREFYVGLGAQQKREFLTFRLEGRALEDFAAHERNLRSS